MARLNSFFLNAITEVPFHHVYQRGGVASSSRRTPSPSFLSFLGSSFLITGLPSTTYTLGLGTRSNTRWKSFIKSINAFISIQALKWEEGAVGSQRLTTDGVAGRAGKAVVPCQSINQRDNAPSEKKFCDRGGGLLPMLHRDNNTAAANAIKVMRCLNI